MTTSIKFAVDVLDRITKNDLQNISSLVPPATPPTVAAIAILGKGFHAFVIKQNLLLGASAFSFITSVLTSWLERKSLQADDKEDKQLRHICVSLTPSLVHALESLGPRKDTGLIIEKLLGLCCVLLPHLIHYGIHTRAPVTLQRPADPREPWAFQEVLLLNAALLSVKRHDFPIKLYEIYIIEINLLYELRSQQGAADLIKLLYPSLLRSITTPLQLLTLKSTPLAWERLIRIVFAQGKTSGCAIHWRETTKRFFSLYLRMRATFLDTLFSERELFPLGPFSAYLVQHQPGLLVEADIPSATALPPSATTVFEVVEDIALITGSIEEKINFRKRLRSFSNNKFTSSSGIEIALSFVLLGSFWPKIKDSSSARRDFNKALLLHFRNIDEVTSPTTTDNLFTVAVDSANLRESLIDYGLRSLELVRKSCEDSVVLSKVRSLVAALDFTLDALMESSFVVENKGLTFVMLYLLLSEEKLPSVIAERLAEILSENPSPIIAAALGAALARTDVSMEMYLHLRSTCVIPLINMLVSGDDFAHKAASLALYSANRFSPENGFIESCTGMVSDAIVQRVSPAVAILPCINEKIGLEELVELHTQLLPTLRQLKSWDVLGAISYRLMNIQNAAVAIGDKGLSIRQVVNRLLPSDFPIKPVLKSSKGSPGPELRMALDLLKYGKDGLVLATTPREQYLSAVLLAHSSKCFVNYPDIAAASFRVVWPVVSTLLENPQTTETLRSLLIRTVPSAILSEKQQQHSPKRSLALARLAIDSPATALQCFGRLLTAEERDTILRLTDGQPNYLGTATPLCCPSIKH